MRRPSRKGLSLAFVFYANALLTAQDLQSIGKENPFSFAGGLSINHIFCASNGVAAARDPYHYFASGNPHLSGYGRSALLSFRPAYKNTSSWQSFSQYPLDATWKGMTAPAGYSSMPYVADGHLFQSGVDVTLACRWKLNTLHGWFPKAVEEDGSRKSSAILYTNGMDRRAKHAFAWRPVLIKEAQHRPPRRRVQMDKLRRRIATHESIDVNGRT
ncbi:MAG: hypothetical protein WA874_04265 [Chryseosolibacter sp.]